MDAPSAWRNGQDARIRVPFQDKPLSGGDLVAAPIVFKPDKAWS